MKIKLNKILANIFFICALFPFVSPMPLHWLFAGTGTDTQPFILLPAILLLVCYVHFKKPYVTKIELLFFIVAMYSLLYINDDPNSFILKKRVGLLFGFILFVVTRRYYHLFSFTIFKYAVNINFILILFSLFYKETFNSTFSFFLRTIKVVNELHGRGATGLSPEPGFAGAVGIFYLCILWYFNQVNNISKKDNYYLSTLILLSILLTKSGTGYLYLFVFMFLWVISNIHKMHFMRITTLVILSIVSLSIYSGANNRGLWVVNKIAKDPISMLNEGSAAQRVYGLNIGLLSLIEGNIFGSGGNSFTKRAVYFHERYRLKQYYHNHNNSYFYPVTAFGRYIVENGIVFLIFLLILFLYCKFTIYNITLRLIAILFLTASLSIAFPATWILIAITTQKNKYYYFGDVNNTLKVSP